MKDYILNFDFYMIKESNEEGYRLYLSEILSTVLKKIITEPIAKKLIDTSLSHDLLFDITCLDIDKDSKMVSYIPKNRLKDVDLNKKPVADDPIWNSNMKQTMNWGRMINKLFPEEFTNIDIDRFYNRYRPEIDTEEKTTSRFKLVHGEEIRYWYLYTNWEGSFGSCMQTPDKQKYFDIYCENIEKCGLLVYFSNKVKDKIIGRSLIWNNLMKPSGDTSEDKNPYTLMDRVYPTNNNSNQIEAAFHKYAIDHNWIYKSGADAFLMNAIRKTSSVATRLKQKEFTYYPYVDTMCYYTPATGRGASTPGNPGRDPNNPSKTFQRYLLRNQDGSKTNL